MPCSIAKVASDLWSHNVSSIAALQHLAPLARSGVGAEELQRLQSAFDAGTLPRVASQGNLFQSHSRITKYSHAELATASFSDGSSHSAACADCGHAGSAARLARSCASSRRCTSSSFFPRTGSPRALRISISCAAVLPRICSAEYICTAPCAPLPPCPALAKTLSANHPVNPSQSMSPWLLL